MKAEHQQATIQKVIDFYRLALRKADLTLTKKQEGILERVLQEHVFPELQTLQQPMDEALFAKICPSHHIRNRILNKAYFIQEDPSKPLTDYELIRIYEKGITAKGKPHGGGYQGIGVGSVRVVKQYLEERGILSSKSDTSPKTL